MPWLDKLEGGIRFTNCPNLRIIEELPGSPGFASLTLMDLPLLQTTQAYLEERQTFVRIERTGLINCTISLPSFYGNDGGRRHIRSIVIRDNPNMKDVSLKGSEVVVTGDCILENLPRATVELVIEQADGLVFRNVASVVTQVGRYSSGNNDGMTVMGNAVMENVDASAILDSIGHVHGNFSMFNVSGRFSTYSGLSSVNNTLKIYNTQEEISATLTELSGNFEIDIAGIIKP